MAKVEIDLTEQDFNVLCQRSMRWDDGGVEPHGFENMTPGKGLDDDFSLEWAYAYDAGDSWASAIFARAFLESVGAPYEILWDTHQTCYWLVTNYETSYYRNKREQERQSGD
jgi:hypothetical protein